MTFLSFSGFLRLSEVVSLRRNDISIKDKHIELSINKSKTDQSAKGSVVVISRTGQHTCPVIALEKYLLAAEIPENSSDFIFRKVSFLKKSESFKLRQGPHLSYTRAREIFLHNLSLLGLDKSKFGLHSFRSGGATSASNRGVPDRLIKKHGRWKTDFAKDGYVKENLAARQSIFASKSAEVVTYHQTELQHKCPQDGWIEEDPIEILESVKTCIAKAVDNLKALNISHQDIKCYKTDLIRKKGIGITNQRQTTIVWDKYTGLPLYNAIVWSDLRTSSTVEKLIEKTPDKSKDYIQPLCGSPLSTDFSALHLHWLLDHCPSVVKAIEEERCLFGNVDSWLVWNLTGGKEGGKHITDVTNASKTLLVDIKETKWSNELCQFFGVNENILPEIRSSSEIYGHMVDGPLKGLPISAIVGDQQAALIGHSHFKKGQMKITFGTALCLSVNTGQQLVLSKNGLLTTVAYQLGPDKPVVYAMEGVSLTAGSCISWLRDNLGIIDTAQQIEDLAKKVDSTHGCYFVPAFSGLYCPYFQNDARGLICGLTQFTTKEHIARAALEAICFQTREIVDAVCQDTGITLETVQVDGGMTADNLLMQLLADLLGVTILRPSMQEATALGVAMAAGHALGIWDLENENGKENMDVFKPSITEKEQKRRFAKWKQAVKHSMHWMTADEQEEEG